MTIHAFDLNLRHLRGVVAIQQKGSVSAAAELVHLSQPALTQGVAKLEAQLDTPLFTRRAGGMDATVAGAALAARSLAAFAHLAGAVRSGRRFTSPEGLMTATQARAFLALADAGSFVGAAAATGLSQPAIHRAVRDLEQVCGQALVDRHGRGIALSRAGLRLARGVRLARGEIAAAIAEITTREGGSVVIGAMPLSRAMLVPRAIAQTVVEAPHVEIDVIEGSWRELVEALRDGAIDLTIGALRPEPGPPDLQQTPLMTDRLMIVGRAGHPLAGVAAPTPGQLAGFPWVVSHAGAPLRALWERLFGAGPLPHAPVHCGSVMVIRGILAESDFLTLLSPQQVALEVTSGVLVAIGPEPEMSGRTIGVTTRRDWRPTRAQARFLDALQRAATGQPGAVTG